jgi:hypothetical protein
MNQMAPRSARRRFRRRAAWGPDQGKDSMKSITPIKPHPFAALLPLMRENEYESLKADVIAKGKFDEKAQTYQGMLLDGRNRQNVSVETGIPLGTEPFVGTDADAIRPTDTPPELWRRELFPLGLRLIERVLVDLAEGRVVRMPQDRAVATWEPAFARPALRKICALESSN